MTNFWKTVDVEIDLSDFSTDDLMRELENRPDNPLTDRIDVTNLYEALQAGDSERALKIAKELARALKIAKELAEAFTGRIVST